MILKWKRWHYNSIEINKIKILGFLLYLLSSVARFITGFFMGNMTAVLVGGISRYWNLFNYFDFFKLYNKEKKKILILTFYFFYSFYELTVSMKIIGHIMEYKEKSDLKYLPTGFC